MADLDLPDVYDPSRHSIHTPTEPSKPPESRDVSAEGLRAVGIGAAIGVAVYLVPFLSFVFSYLNILAHEFGHALASWSFGYPAVPAFDWRYGGGVTLTGERHPLVFLACWGILGAAVYVNRHVSSHRNMVLAVVAVYGIVAFTPVHRIIELAMGHLMELILAGVFLYRSLSGRAVVHAVERPLYAACGVFMILHNVSLSWGLMTDIDARTAYGMAKGGGHWMDLSRISIDYLGIGLPLVAFGLFAACWATPVVVYCVHRFEPHLGLHD